MKAVQEFFHKRMIEKPKRSHSDSPPKGPGIPIGVKILPA
jgi:hypothetical protein